MDPGIENSVDHHGCRLLSKSECELSHTLSSQLKTLEDIPNAVSSLPTVKEGIFHVLENIQRIERLTVGNLPQSLRPAEPPLSPSGLAPIH